MIYDTIMPQPNRNFDGQEYCYGFQGQEKDSELKGEGLSVNYKYRMHDPRIGRFFAVDPLASQFPWNSSYAFSENRLLDRIEPEGLESKIVIKAKNPKDDIVFQRTPEKAGTKWQATKASFYKAFAGHDNWIKGQSLYKSSTENYTGPSNGTLTVDATGGVAEISYEKGSALEVTKQSLSMGVKAIDVFLFHPDPMVEGSQKFKNTIDNYITMVTLPITFETLLANPKNIINIASVLNDIDDVSGGEKGSVLIQLAEGNDTAETIVIFAKTITSFTSKNKSLKEFAVDAKGNSDKLKALISTAKNTKDTFSGLEKINDNVIENKNDEQ